MNTKIEFSRRFALALDHAKAPSLMPARKKWIHEKFGITQRQAGNYLNAQQLPTCEGMIEIARTTGVSWEWLTTGRGSMLPVELDFDEAELLSKMSRENRKKFFEIARLLPLSNAA